MVFDKLKSFLGTKGQWDFILNILQRHFGSFFMERIPKVLAHLTLTTNTFNFENTLQVLIFGKVLIMIRRIFLSSEPIR